MKYPGNIRPQQIQGLDYRAIEELLLWLKVIISDIQNSIPTIEILAAQQVFEDEFSFDYFDCPSNTNAWFSSKLRCSNPPGIVLGCPLDLSSQSICSLLFSPFISSLRM